MSKRAITLELTYWTISGEQIASTTMDIADEGPEPSIPELKRVTEQLLAEAVQGLCGQIVKRRDYKGTTA